MTDDQIADEAIRQGFDDSATPPVADESLRHRDACDTPLGGPGDQPADEVDPLARIRNGSWLRAQQFPALRFAVPGLIPEGFTLLIGPPKAGKSYLLLNMLLAVAAGGPALSVIPTGPARRVLYLALEDGHRRMQTRCAQLLGDRADIPDLFDYAIAVAPGGAGTLIEAYLDRHRDTALVVIDTLGKVMPPAAQGESSYQRDYRVGSGLKRLADSQPGLAVVVAHHDRKATADDFVDAVSGTHGLAGAADTVVVLDRKRQSTEALLKITGRDVPEDVYALKVGEGVFTLDGTDLAGAAAAARRREEAGALGDRSAEILNFAAANPDGVTPAEVEAKFGPDARQNLVRLYKSGRLARPQRGRYTLPQTPVTSVTKSQAETCSYCGWPVDSEHHDITCGPDEEER